MKCLTHGCTNIIIDFTGNVDGMCAKCRLLELFLYFGSPNVDTERLEQTQVDKQDMVDAQGYDEGGHYQPEIMAERLNI